jgi:hypothetical protein
VVRRAKPPPTDKLRTNVLGMFLAVIGFGLVTALLTVTLSAKDLLWFTRGFSTWPVRMIVYHEGQRTQLTAGQEGFQPLADAVLASLSQGAAHPSGIGLSEGSQQEAYSLYISLEVFFEQPVKLHAWFNTGDPTQMLFLITGRHSDLNVVFLGKDGYYLASPPVLNTTQPIRDALAKMGYLPSGQ